MTKKDILRRRYFSLNSALDDLLGLKEYSIKEFNVIFPAIIGNIVDSSYDPFPSNKLQSFFGIDAEWFKAIKKRGRRALKYSSID